MATYKVLQDIEAEDKILGPLTLKQFILAIVDIILIIVAFRLAVSNWLLVIPFLPPIAVLSILAAPLGRDQPTETWLLAKLRFYLKPHVRIWDQDGVMNLVTITAPKRAERIYTNNLSQGEVRSRLNALANTLDSRGWAVKNALNVSSAQVPDDTDRLVAASSLPQNVPTIQVDPADDIMDETINPLAMKIDSTIKQNTADYKKKVQNSVQQKNVDYSFIDQANVDHKRAKEIPSDMSVFSSSAAIKPGTQNDDEYATRAPAKNSGGTAEEKAFLEKLHKNKSNENTNYYSHLKRLKTSDELAEERAKKAALEVAKKAQEAVTRTPDAATLELANNSDDLKVETIAKLANRKPSDDDEVVISLH